MKESRRSLNKLRLAAETVKHTLSTLGNAQCAVDSLFEGVDFHSQVSRYVIGVKFKDYYAGQKKRIQ